MPLTNGAGQMFGQERLQAIVTANAGSRAKQVCQAVLKVIDNFIQGTLPLDGITLLIVKRQL